MDITKAQDFIRANHHAVLHTFRKNGSPQMSPVAVALDDEGRALVSSRESAIKAKNLMRDPRAMLCLLNDGFFGEWYFVEGPCQVVHLPEAMDLLVAYYRSVAGEHPDWDEYRAAMEKEQRVVLRITIERAGPDIAG